MIVCHCEVVSGREITAALERGGRTVEHVGMMTGAGTGCGGCHGSIRALIERCCEQRPQAEEKDEAA